MTLPTHMMQLQSLVTAQGTLEVSLVEVPLPEPGPDQVLVRVEASPINPSDLGMLLAGADLSTLAASSAGVTADLPPAVAAMMAGRVGQSLPVGNEGAGVVVAAGSSDAAQALVGATVAMLGGAMYAQYRVVPVAAALRLPDGTDPRDGASMFVNPLTALGMTVTMKREGHSALVHTAAASNLGQMLVKICNADEIPLVNVVRRQSQVELLRSIGANHVVDSSVDSFRDDLVDAVTRTGATLGFDATGGGRLAGQILSAMEAAAVARQAGEFSRYGSTTHKQVYIYGGLDRGKTELDRSYGASWGLGGWLLPNFLAAVGPEVADGMRQRVVDEMHTTFASGYTNQVSLAQALEPGNIMTYAAQATGEKFLVTPHA